MGWLPLSGVPQRQEHRTAVEIRPLDDPVFSGTCGGNWRAEDGHFVLDGEIAIPAGATSRSMRLLQRIHPAPSGVRKLSVETPSLLIAFDLLVAPDGELLTGQPLDRDDAVHLEAFYAEEYYQGGTAPSPIPIEYQAQRSERVAAPRRRALDGVIASGAI